MATIPTLSARGRRLREFHTETPLMQSRRCGQNQRRILKMKSRDNISTSGPIPFPKSSRGEVSPPADEDRAIAREHDAEIRELCRDTALALQGLRHGIANVF